MDAHVQQEELERLKAWWKDYGNALIAGVLLGVAILFGYRYWNEYKERQRVEASALYEELLVAQRGKQAERLRELGGKLVKDHAATPYAGMAALVLARHAHESGDVAGARRHLEWVLANADEPAAAHAARLRLARLLAASGDARGALALAETKDMAGFEAEYHELRGDLLVQFGRRDEARRAYQEALKHPREASGYNSVLQMKLDDLGSEAKP